MSDQDNGQAAVETEARSMGWVPETEFRGDKTKWTDAATYVERGHTVLPILRANNKRLEGELAALRGETQSVKELFAASQEAIAELQTAHTENTKRAVKQARDSLMAELKQARTDGDVELETKISDELADLRAAERTAENTPKEKPAPAAAPAVVDPDLTAWMGANPWYGTDNRKTLRANGIAQELRADPENDALVGRAFYDKILDVMDERTGGGTPRTSKVSGSRPSGGSGGGGGKGYANLPADAQAACNRQGQKLVGPGRAYKDLPSWQAAYAATFFQE